MTTMLSRDMATPRQVSYMLDMCRDREIPSADALVARLEAGEVTFAQAKEYIPLMQGFPRKARTVSAHPVTEEGVYEHNGKIYRVKRSKTSHNLYAMESDYTIAELTALKAADPDLKIKVTFEYDRGAIFKIDATCRITVERAEELSALISNCIVCGRTLRAKESVARSIGPVCITRV